MHRPQCSAARPHLGSVGLGSLGLDGPVGDDDDGPFELVLEALDHLVADLAEVAQGSEGDPD